MVHYEKKKLPDSVKLTESIEEDFLNDDFKISENVPALYEEITDKKLGKSRYKGKLTPERYEAIVKYVKAGAHISHAASAVGVTDVTIREWIQRGIDEPDTLFGCFVDDLKRAKSAAINRNLAIVQRAAYDDWKAAQWLLSVLDPEVYSTRNTARVEITGANGKELQANFVISDEELQKLAGLQFLIEEQNKVVDADYKIIEEMDEKDKYHKDLQSDGDETTCDDTPDVIPQ